MTNIIKSRRIYSIFGSSDSLSSTDITLTGDRFVYLDGYDFNLSGGNTIITGIGSTVATESFSIFNSSGVKSFRVTDDGSITNQGGGDIITNTSFGVEALVDNTTGTNNTSFGYKSSFITTTGTGNSALGSYTLYSNIVGTSNTAIGDSAGYSNTGTGSVFLGFSAGYYETASSKLFIDNATRASEADARTKALVYGVFDAAVANQIFTVNGVVSIGGPPTNSQVSFEILGTTKAMRIPVMTATERNAIGATIDGLMIYNSTSSVINYTSASGTWRTFVSETSTQTLTAKRITPRNTATTQSATPTINSDNSDVITITALAQAITSMTTNLSGTPTEGQTLIINITDNGTPRAITWGAKFVGALLPITTATSKALHVKLGYNSTAAVWYCMSSTQEP